MVTWQLAEERALGDAKRRAGAVAAVVQVSTDRPVLERTLAEQQAGTRDRIALYLPNGEVGIGTAHPGDVARVRGTGEETVADTHGGVAVLQPVKLGTGATAVVEVAVPGSQLHRGVIRFWGILLAVAAFLVAASVLVGDRLAARMVGATRALANGARDLGAGQLQVRVRPAGPRELAEVAAAFNTMADRMVTVLAADRELIADLSHRLRTPLTALKLDVETVGDDAGAVRIREAVGALERDIDDLIRTARRPAADMTAEFCDAGSVIRERMRFWTAIADDQERPCEVVGTDEFALVGVPRADLAAAVDALLGNVLRYTPQGTGFRLSIGRTDGQVSVLVEDAGSGFPDPQRALRRGASDTGSTGLGIDVARRAALTGGGDISLGRSVMGGASVELRFADAAVRERSGLRPVRRWRRRLWRGRGRGGSGRTGTST